MSDRGHFIVPRDIFEKPLGAGPCHVPRLAMAAVRGGVEDREQEVSNGRTKAVIQPQRGQLTYSIRYMVKAWGLTERRVRTILRSVQKRAP